MKLTKAHITKYKSIEDSTEVEIDEKVTVLVGVNEAGKSAFLEGLYKANSVLGGAEYSEVFDYPRKDWSTYSRRSDKKEVSEVAKLVFAISDDEAEAIESDLGGDVLSSRKLIDHHHIDNTSTVVVPAKEGPYVKRAIEAAGLTDELKAKLKGITTIHELIDALNAEEQLGEKASEFLSELEAKFKPLNDTWKSSRLASYIWKHHLKKSRPDFLYFSDYNILPGKINIETLKQAKAEDTQDPALMTALGLLEMANVSLEELQNPDSYEEIKAILEAVSLDISNKVFNYWRQNKQLLVEFDVKSDENEQAPFNNGPNLYIRVKNLEHGVSVPFDQRSKGFVWFFSFIVWFNSVQNRISTDKELILLLDEPGLSLHGLAQADFLYYIDDLSDEHQIIYTTHSPFMIDSEKLHQVRTVEDIKSKGTVVAGGLNSTDKRTLFPLQAGLGYSLAQNLFIAKKNALVEGPADLVYWKYFSATLERLGRTYLDEKVVIVPTGGLDKIATFVSLLMGNELEMAVVHDYDGTSDARLDSLVKAKIIKEKQIANYAQFRDPAKPVPTDVEDMISEDLYLDLFNAAYATQLNGVKVAAKDLPKGDRMTQRITDYLKAKKIELRPTGGYNHYLVASYLASNPVVDKKIDAETLNRFERLFTGVNDLLK